MPIERDDLGTRIIGNGVRGIQFYDDERVLRHEIYLDGEHNLHISSSIVSSTTLVAKIAYVTTNTVQDLIVTGTLTFGLSGSGMYQGTGSFEAPDTGLKIWNHDGIGRIASFSGGVEQVYFDTDGRLYAGAGAVMLDENGESIETGASQSDPATIKYFIREHGGYSVRQDAGSAEGYAELLRIYAVNGAAGSVIQARSWEYYTASWNEIEGHLTLSASSSGGNSSIALYGNDDPSGDYGILITPVSGLATRHWGDLHITGDGTTADLRVTGGVYVGSLGVDPADGAIYATTAVFVGETACTDLTVGLVINQGAYDNAALVFKSSDVNQPNTDGAEADTYGRIQKAESTAGGLLVRGLKDADGVAGLALNLNGRLGEAADTTKSTSAVGVVVLTAQVTDGGTGIADVGSDGNLVVIRNNVTARFIFDAEGSAHSDVEWTTFDEHDDLALLDALEDAFGGFLDERRAVLERLGVAQFDERPGHAMVNWSRLAMLLTGAIRQLAQRSLPA